MDIEDQRRIEALLGGRVVRTERVRGGGFTPAERWICQLADGRSAFAKVAVSALTAEWVRAEHRRYAAIRGPFLARCHGLADHPSRPILVLEDLSRGRWPPPWEPGDVQRVLATLARVAATPCPPGLPSLADQRREMSGWLDVADDPAPFLSLAMCSPAWLDRALPVLLDAQGRAALDGDALCHGDVRSDNLCLLDDRVVLVDWNCAARGDARTDVAFWAPSLRLEGGPRPDDLVDDPALAALVAGWFAARAGLPEIPDAPRVRWIQRRQLRIALPWAARALDLPPPDGAWAQAEQARAHEALAAGGISEGEWYDAVEESLVDAYLAADNPRAASGKSGDEVDWRWSRELVLDAVVGQRCDLLDVGCANGHLLASLVQWGDERGLQVEPFGLEISERLARVARVELPRWAERVSVGNVLDWTPGRRFDLVHTGLDYVPPARRRDLVERILRDLLKPDGRLVLRPERAGPHDPVAQLAAIGLAPDGVLEAEHPITGAVRRTAWVDRR